MGKWSVYEQALDKIKCIYSFHLEAYQVWYNGWSIVDVKKIWLLPFLKLSVKNCELSVVNLYTQHIFSASNKCPHIMDTKYQCFLSTLASHIDSKGQDHLLKLFEAMGMMEAGYQTYPHDNNQKCSVTVVETSQFSLDFVHRHNRVENIKFILSYSF